MYALIEHFHNVKSCAIKYYLQEREFQKKNKYIIYEYIFKIAINAGNCSTMNENVSVRNEKHICKLIQTTEKEFMNTNKTPSLGKNMRRIRTERGWSMIKMCDAIGINQSSLSKVENDLMSLSYDRLVEVAQRLNIDISELFMAEPEGRNSIAASARICVDRANDAKLVKWENFRYQQLGVEVKDRLMIATYGEVTAVKGKTERELGDHSGERFLYVLEGTVEFHSEFYETYILNAGDSIYFDIRLKHSFVAPQGKKAKCIVVTASEDRKFMEMERALASQGLSNIAEVEQKTRRPARKKR